MTSLTRSNVSSMILSEKAVSYKRCMVCDSTNVIVTPLEILPDRSILWKAVHTDDNRMVHTWSEAPPSLKPFNSTEEEFEQFFGLLDAKKKQPTRMKCPACGSIGRVNWYRPNKNQPQTIGYILVHEHIGGKVGRVSQVFRRRRCYINDKEQREVVLRKLGRYIGKDVR